MRAEESSNLSVIEVKDLAELDESAEGLRSRFSSCKRGFSRWWLDVDAVAHALGLDFMDEEGYVEFHPFKPPLETNPIGIQLLTDIPPRLADPRVEAIALIPGALIRAKELDPERRYAVASAIGSLQIHHSMSNSQPDLGLVDGSIPNIRWTIDKQVRPNVFVDAYTSLLLVPNEVVRGTSSGPMRKGRLDLGRDAPQLKGLDEQLLRLGRLLGVPEGVIRHAIDLRRRLSKPQGEGLRVTKTRQ